jgi:hypothetical protein
MEDELDTIVEALGHAPPLSPYRVGIEVMCIKLLV